MVRVTLILLYYNKFLYYALARLQENDYQVVLFFLLQPGRVPIVPFSIREHDDDDDDDEDYMKRNDASIHSSLSR